MNYKHAQDSMNFEDLMKQEKARNNKMFNIIGCVRVLLVMPLLLIPMIMHDVTEASTWFNPLEIIFFVVVAIMIISVPMQEHYR